MIEALDRFWRSQNANVHRGVYRLSEEATEAYERSRRAVAARLGADRREVVFVRNATEALNLVAYSWGRREHRARATESCSPRWSTTRTSCPGTSSPRERGAELDWAPVTDDGPAGSGGASRGLLERGPKVVAVAHVSNVLGTINPIAEIARLAHDAGALVVVDGAQAGPQAAARHGRAGGGLLRAHRAQDVRADGDRGALRAGASCSRRCRRSSAAAR